MDGKTAAKGGVLIALVIAAAYFGFRNLSADGEDWQGLDNLVAFRCDAPGCGYEFEITGRDAKGRGIELVPCPKCGSKDLLKGYKCSACGRVNMPVGHNSRPTTCEFCKANPFVGTDEVKANAKTKG